MLERGLMVFVCGLLDFFIVIKLSKQPPTRRRSKLGRTLILFLPVVLLMALALKVPVWLFDRALGFALMVLVATLLYPEAGDEDEDRDIEIVEDKEGFPFLRTLIAWAVLALAICKICPQIPLRIASALGLWASTP